MLCPSCGTDCGEEVQLCEKCREKKTGTTNEHAQDRLSGGTSVGEHFQPENQFPISILPYGGFWLRFSALTIDTAILTLLTSFCISFLTKVLGGGISILVSSKLFDFFQPSNLLWLWILSFIAALFFFLMIIACLGMIYFVVFESSQSQATPGKNFCGLIVTDREGQQISWRRSLARYLLKALSTLPFLAGYFCMLFTERQQTLHDLLSGCIIYNRRARPTKQIIVATIISICLIVSFGKGPSKGRSLHASRMSRQEELELPTQSPQQNFETQTPKPSESIQPKESPAPQPEEEAFTGPHAVFVAQTRQIEAKSIVAFYYPTNNSVAIGFYPAQISEAERENLKKRSVVAKASDSNRPLLVMNLEFTQGKANITEKDLIKYSLQFYKDSNRGFTFNSVNEALSLSKNTDFKSKELMNQNEKWQISGNLSSDRKLKLLSRGIDSPKSNPQIHFLWDIDEEFEVYSTKGS